MRGEDCHSYYAQMGCCVLAVFQGSIGKLIQKIIKKSRSYQELHGGLKVWPTPLDSMHAP